MKQPTARERMNHSIAQQRRRLLAGRAKITMAQKALDAALIALKDAQRDLEHAEVLDLDLPDIILQIETVRDILRDSKTHTEQLLDQSTPL